MPRILPLPPDAISQIHSSKQITSLQGVVLALLENSLDAGATRIEVVVDLARGGCTVEDNGSGVPSLEFEEHGKLGKMYCTSKHPHAMTEDLHGSDGTYLASLAALSLLTIVSRQRDSQSLARLSFHHNKVIDRQIDLSGAGAGGLYSAGMHASMEHGTTVVVRDLFGNMPVRVKQRCLARETPHQDEKAWAELKYGIAALMLAWSRPCCVKLRDSGSNDRVVNICAYHASITSMLTEKSLNQLSGKPATFNLDDKLPILIHAGLAAADSRHNWVAIATSASNITVKGAICLDPAPTKQCQFITIGIHACGSSSGHNELYDAVNKPFAASDFGSIDTSDDLDETEKDRHDRDRRYQSDGYTQKQLHGRKGVDRWPMFVLQAKFRDQQRHQTAVGKISDPTFHELTRVLEATVTRWLTANHFRPRKRKGKKCDEQQRPALAIGSPRQPSLTSDFFTSGKIVSETVAPKRATTAESASSMKRCKVFDLSGGADALMPIESPVAAIPGVGMLHCSRFRSGRAASSDGLLSAKKIAPLSASGKSWGTDVFQLRELQAGALNSTNQKLIDRTIPTTTNSTLPMDTPDLEQSGLVSSDDFGSVDEDAMIVVAADGGGIQQLLCTVDQDHMACEQDDVFDWTDPMTKQSFKVNARTGVVLPPRQKTTAVPTADTSPNPTSVTHRAAINTSLSSAGRPLSLSRRATAPDGRAQTSWLPGFLEKWDNPIFKRQDEERIPVASFVGPALEVLDGASKECCSGSGLAPHFTHVGTAGTTKLSKTALKKAKVIRQVDEKFILCRMAADADEESGKLVLVLVDQHAASERVILERLLQELCAPADASDPRLPIGVPGTSIVKTTLLQKFLRFQISAQEQDMFRQRSAHFADWGIHYDLISHEPALTASQVRQPSKEHRLIVRALPPSIAERCTLLPNLIIELLRSEIWALAESYSRLHTAPTTTNIVASDNGGGNDNWLKRIGPCPKGLLDLLNSRACRSAIMFNDKLSVLECEELMTGLGRCAFPFMCAHGRVSMVPLMDIGGAQDDGDRLGIDGSVGRAEHSFAKAFMNWQKTCELPERNETSLA